MKKLLIAVCFMLGFAGIASAQQVKKPVATKIEKVQPATAKATPAAKEAAATGPVKADGTLDKRYKVNKEARSTAVKLKKDGTPDKRFKTAKKG